MNIKINIEGKIRDKVEERVTKTEKMFWKEIEKLRIRVLDLELINSALKKRRKNV